MPRMPRPTRHSHMSCSAIALATVMVVGASPAAAQSFDAAGTYATNPVAGGITTGAGTTNIALNGGQTIIDWAPTDTGSGTSNIVFQPGGTTATFSSASDFAVLNRINPADINRPIGMDGTINSLVGGQTGGSVYFYSPSGFVLGATSSINVGSLVLSASPLALDGNNNFISGTSVTFSAASNAAAKILTMPGSQINALNQGSYVAMVAPRVQHHGTIAVNGSAALVGAEAATINFSPDGLFDIQVTTGTTDGGGVAVFGDIGGPASDGTAGDQQRVYLVAVPKNDALTMVIGAGSDLGFTLANNASIDANGAVVLSAGHDVTDGVVAGESAAAGNIANVTINGAHVTSNLTGDATGAINIFSNAGQVTTFDSGVDLHALGQLWMTANSTGSISVGGDLGLSTDLFVTDEGVSGTASEVRLATSDTATIVIGGDVTLSANAAGVDSFTSGVNGGDRTGGTITVQTFGGSIQTGSLTATANGTGGWAFGGSAVAGEGTGGIIDVKIGNSSATLVNGNLTLTANGEGGATPASGATGTGGAITIGGLGSGGGSSLEVDGNTTLTADGRGVSDVEGSGIGGNGVGGTIDIGSGNPDTFNFLGDLALSAFAQGSGGGGAQGGDLTIDSSGATVFVSNDLTMSADAQGGHSDVGIGGNATGGTATITSSAAVSIGDAVTVSAAGTGGGADNGDGGTGKGGIITLTAADGSLNLGGPLDLYAVGRGGYSTLEGATTGAGTGGTITIEAQTNGALSDATYLFADASGYGGDTFGVGVNGGDGTGGDIAIQASGDNATVSFGNSAFVTADGRGGSGGECVSCGGMDGDGFGGTISIGADDADSASLTIAGALFADADGYGSAGITGNAGSGTGGSVIVSADDGAGVGVQGDVNIRADGYGGYHEGDTAGGSGTGGTAELRSNSGAILTLGGSAYLDALGFGGGTSGDSFGGTGGDGLGGNAGIDNTGGSTTIAGDVYATATGQGGSAYGGTGGDGTGKFARVRALDGDISIGGSAYVDASGVGGIGDIGGSGTGGGDPVAFTDGAHILVRNGDITIGGSALVSADGTGGGGANGGDGGGGSGGWVTVVSRNSDLGPSSITVQGVESGLFASADGSGGDGGAGSSGITGGDGGAGGIGTGGLISVVANAGNGALNIDFVNATATGAGGDGGNGGNGDGGPGGNGGAGGDAFGGFVTVGTSSGDPELGATGFNDGVGNFGSIFIDASAAGGRGGDGNDGSAGGNGGDGGDAVGGGAELLVRGSTVNVDTVTLTANANGGDAGFGYVPNVGTPGVTGIGGDATVGGDGGIAVIVTSRFLIPEQRGTLNAGSIGGTAIATSGIGIPNGSSAALGGSEVTFLNSDGTIGSLDFQIGFGGQNPSTSGNDSISVINGAVDIAAAFSFTTAGALSLYTSTSSLTADTVTLAAADFVPDAVEPAPAIPGTLFANSFDITTGNNFYADANLDSVNDLVITALGSIRFDDAISDAAINLSAQGGSIDLADVTANGDVILDANSAIILGTVNAGLFHAEAGTTFTSLDITSDSNIQISAGGNVTLGDLVAGPTADINSNKAIRIDADGSVLVGDIVALGGIDVTAQGSVTGDNVTTGDVLFTEANGAISYGNISAGIVNPQPSTEPVSVGLDSATSLNVGDIDAAGTIGLITSGTLTAGDLATGADILGLVHGDIIIGGINAAGRVFLADSTMFTNAGGTIGDAGNDNVDPEVIFAATPVPTGGSITIGDVFAGSFQAAAGTDLTTGLVTSDGGISLDVGGAISTGDLTAGNFVLANGGSITTGNIDAFSVAMTSSGGDIGTGDINAFGAVELDAFGDIATGDIIAGSIDLFAGDDITTGDLTTQFILSFALGDGGPITTLLFPGASITLESGGDISTGDIDSIDGVHALAGGSINTGNIDANDFIGMEAGADMSTLNLTSGSDIDLHADGDMAFGDVNAGFEFDFEADGGVTGGNIVAGVTVEGEAEGAIVLEDITAGFGEGPVDDDTFSVGIISATSISVGNVQGPRRIGFATLGDLTTGNITTGWDFLALVGDDTTTGAITTGAGDNVYIANASMCATGGGCGGNADFDPELVLAVDPVPTGGSITINGPVSTGLFRAAAGDDLTTAAINADDIVASAGGTATLNGVWSTEGSVMLTSNDIDIASNGGIDAGFFLTLISTNPTQALIGDGLSGSGYALSNAEFGRISGYEVEIIGRSDATAAADMLIGDLNVTGPQAGSNVEGSDLNFATGDIGEGSASGVIRVVGDVNATGFGIDADQSVNFFTGRFELDAATGSISVFSSGTTLGGELGLYADEIHVASGALLDQLADNPQFSGYVKALNDAAEVQRPEGVLNASVIWIESENLQNILIQNTGTLQTPAGFTANEIFVNDDFEVAGPPGSIDVVANGQLITEGGTLTGVAVRDALVEGEDLEPFTPTSTINGCLLTGFCANQPPPVGDVTPSQISLIFNNPLGDGNFGNEPEIDDNEEGDEGADSPIQPPHPLFDTRPLVPGGEVNDPVSGTGNPALVGGAEQECETDERGKCTTQSEQNKKGGKQ